MSDRDRRGLERTARTGDPDAGARALASRRRLGTLTLESLEWAAYLGDPGARLALTAERPLCTCDMGGRTHGPRCELAGQPVKDGDYRIPPGLWKWIRHLPNERQIIARAALAIAELFPMAAVDPGAEDMLAWAAAARAWLDAPGDAKARALEAAECHAPHVRHGARCPMTVRDRAQDLRVVSHAIRELDAARGLTRLADRALAAAKLPGKTEEMVRAVVREATLPWILRETVAPKKKSQREGVVRTGCDAARASVSVMVKKHETGSASKRIDGRIEELDDWRGKTLQRVRELIKRADPGIVEEWKWENPVWSHDGLVCTGEAYKKVVKLTFAKGATLKDPSRLFNSSLEGKVRRAIDLREGDDLDETAFKKLIRAAVALNRQGRQGKRPPAAAKVVLLAGGNPQIAKGDGDEPVQAYIAAMPEWKQAVGRRLDALIVRTVPDVRKAVRWNSPFYGIEGQGWFVSFHVFTRYVKVTFFKGTSLRPVPPGGTHEDARWIDVHEGELDEAQMAKWVKQAARIPGWGNA